MKRIKIFLASSSELVEDRRELELSIARKNDELVDRGIYLDLVIWEDFLDLVSKTRLQDEYNKVILQCDIFIMLFFTKVGKFTFEEFMVAYESLKQTGKPQILTYFKDAPINSGSLNERDVLSLFEFRNKLRDVGHFVTQYGNTGDLKYHFSKQLAKMDIAPQDVGRGKSATANGGEESGVETPGETPLTIVPKAGGFPKKFLMMAGGGLLLLICIWLIVARPWEEDDPIGGGGDRSGSISHHGQHYNWKKLKDGKKWLTQNLNVEISSETWCFDNNCNRYGRMYTQKDAVAVCASLGGGWVLPTKDDWVGLAMIYGGYERKLDSRNSVFEGHEENRAEAYEMLKTELIPDGQYPGMKRDPGTIMYAGDLITFWSATATEKKDTKHDRGNINYLFMIERNEGPLKLYAYAETYGLSCRCVNKTK